ncbi:hypothetical protein CPB83DRAFT_849192 [Crepidotus variabilis]|uniref:F-box domain-containing protein n=1 Tax=Crepidotus variabilis TaxID=179855 RepID=A0A9P6ELW3_9AGAR|nr:hypothetical protein CPB83DRAFT_849192 [Crepidotus variabilis]
MVKPDYEPGQSFLLDQYPFELVAAVLGQAAQVNHENAERKPRFIASPLILRQVCRSWKAFVDSTPSLWQALVISFPRMETDIVTGVKKWSNRVGTLPIDVYIDGSNLRQTLAWFKKFEAIGDSLAILHPKWRLLELLNVKNFFVNLIQSRLRRAFGGLTIFPILEVVAIHISPNEFSHPTALDFRSLDKLKCLDIRGQKNNFNAHAIPQTQAAQLTNFRLERTSFDFEALGLFVNLRVLHFSPFDAPPARPFGLMSKVLLEQLESLTFVATSWNLTLSIFQRLCLPKLLNLSIALHSSPEPDSDSDTQTIPEVQPLFEEELHSILASFRQVTQLGLVVKTKELTIGRPFFEGLGLLKGPVRLPKLRLFSYEGNLQLESVFCLQSILERCSCRSPPPTTPNSSGSGSYSPDVAALKFVKIKSNDLRPFLLPNNFSRGTEAYATIKEMVVQNTLWLIDDEDKALI